MKLPKISEISAKNNLPYVVTYIKNLVNLLQDFIDKSAKEKNEKYVVDIIATENYIKIEYSDKTTKEIYM